MKYLFLLLFIPVGIAGCGSDKTSYSSKNNKVFEVTDAFCEEMKLPLINFSLEYPKTLKTDPAQKGITNYNYNAFVKLNSDEIQTEGISLGYYKPSGENIFGDGLKRDLLGQMKGIYQQIFKLSESTIDPQTFDGERYLMLRAKGKGINKSGDSEFAGDYIIQTLYLEPQGDNENGLLITFIGNELSPYKTFEDFASKGDISVVWKTLKFK